MNLQAVYDILRKIIQTKDTITYQDLSYAYLVNTGMRVDKRDWSSPLFEVSGRCTQAGFPPISTVVVRGDDGMPGDGYWGIPGAPPYKDYNMWKKVCSGVYATKWPAVLP